MTREQVLEILEKSCFSKKEEGVYYYNNSTVEVGECSMLVTFFQNNNCIGGASLLFENITSLKIYVGYYMVDSIVFEMNGLLYYIR